MKILLFADLHLHTWAQFGADTESGLPRRLAEQEAVLKQITELDRSRKIDLNIFAGDWFHLVGSHPTEVLHVTRKFFEENKTPTEIVDGNHDLVKRSDPREHHRASNIIRSYTTGMTTLPFKMRLIHYQDESDFEQTRGYDVVVLHKQPQVTNKHGYAFEGVDWKRLAANNRFVFFGHYHTHEELAPNCFVIGSTVPLTFSDEGERGVYILDTDIWKAEFVPLKSPKFITVPYPAQVVVGDGNYYKVLVPGEMKAQDNVIRVRKPAAFEERIKSDDFQEILRDWLRINGKDDSMLEHIKELTAGPGVSHRNIFKGRLRAVSIADFISVDSAQYTLDNGFTFISGGGASTGSNGSGKTTIFGESIYWALFGETTKGLTGNDVIRRGKKDCSVTLVLEGAEEKIIIRRSRKAGLEVICTDPNGTADIVHGYKEADKQRTLEEQILGFDKQLFQTACYFSQEGLIMLTGLSDTKRTDMITGLLGFSTYDDLHIQALAKQKSLEAAKTVDEVEQQNIQNEIAILVKQIEISRTHREEYVKMAERAKESADSHRASADMSQRQAEEAKTIVVQEAQVDYDKLIAENDSVIRGVQDSITDLKNRVATLGIAEQINTLKQQLGEQLGNQLNIEKHIPVLENEIARLQNLQFDVKCDKCGNYITAATVQIFVSEKTAQIKAYMAESAKYDTSISELRTGIDELVKADRQAQGDIALFEKKLAKLHKTEKELASASAAQGMKKVDAERRVESFLSEARYQSGLAEKDMESCQGYTARSEREAKEEGRLHAEKMGKEVTAKAVAGKVAEIIKGIEVLDFWKTAFSAKGIRAVLLDRFCNEFNGIVNDYLAVASKGEMGVIVSPTTLLKSAEARNKVDVRILLADADVQYASLSGGEKRRVDIALCLALNKWVSTKYGVPCGPLGVLILDEVFSFIDRLGEESIATLLYEEGQTKSVMVISHTPELESYATKVYSVRKENGVSILDTGSNDEK